MSLAATRRKYIDNMLQTLDGAGPDIVYLTCIGGFGHDIELSDRDQEKLKKLQSDYLGAFRRILRNAKIKVSDEAIARRCSTIDISGILERLQAGGAS